MTIVDELYYSKNPGQWYRKGIQYQRDFGTIKPHKHSNGDVVFGLNFPLLENVEGRATVVLTAKDIEALKKVI